MEELIRIILVTILVSCAVFGIYTMFFKERKPIPPIDNGDCVQYVNLSDDMWAGSYTDCNDEYHPEAVLPKHGYICVKEGTVITSTSVVELTINGRC